MRLAELSEGIGRLLEPDSGKLEVYDITHDSRKVQHGTIFVAIEGSQGDGHQYIGAASQIGAVCVMTARPEKVACHMPILQVRDPRKAMAQLARKLFKYPDQVLKVIGVTGTNGKTTTTYLLDNLLRQSGKTGRLGTLSYFNGVSEEKAARTTPESSDMFRYLGEMVNNDCRYAAIEVSSHGLMFDRISGLQLAYAIFTNLTKDHLDFHGDMESYFRAKNRLFDHLVEGGAALVNWDDPYGRKLKLRTDVRLVRYGTHPEADLRFHVEALGVKGSRFSVTYEDRGAHFSLPLLGTHNIYNFVAALGVALLEGIPLAELTPVTATLTPVPGRTEFLDLGQDFGVIVDFAHTPDALKQVLRGCREAHPKKVIVVFGAGGNRDESKRAEMGAVVDDGADVVILTSDNPRNEDPGKIMDMIQTGIERPPGPGFVREPDRRKAIAKAIAMAEVGDLVLLAGKGHEKTQEIKGIHHPFCDKLVAAEMVRKRLEGRGNV